MSADAEDHANTARKGLGSSLPHIPDLELLRPIAAGSYGEVWLARSIVGTLRAVKIVRRDRFERAEDFDREFKGLQKFEPVSRTHDGLVDILHIGRHESEGWFHYVMELADDAEGMKKEEGRVQKDLPARSATSVSSFCLLPLITTPLALSGTTSRLEARCRRTKPSRSASRSPPR